MRRRRARHLHHWVPRNLHVPARTAADDRDHSDPEPDEQEQNLRQPEPRFPSPAAFRRAESARLHGSRQLAAPSDGEHEQRKRLAREATKPSVIRNPPGSAREFEGPPVVQEQARPAAAPRGRRARIAPGDAAPARARPRGPSGRRSGTARAPVVQWPGCAVSSPQRARPIRRSPERTGTRSRRGRRTGRTSAIMTPASRAATRIGSTRSARRRAATPDHAQRTSSQATATSADTESRDSSSVTPTMSAVPSFATGLMRKISRVSTAGARTAAVMPAPAWSPRRHPRTRHRD